MNSKKLECCLPLPFRSACSKPEGPRAHLGAGAEKASERKLSPVLKWAGGKTQLLGAIRDALPPDYLSYHEPFVGGGAALFGICPARAFANDVNGQLANLYMQLKGSVESVIGKVNELDALPCTKELYRSARERYNAKVSSGVLDAEGAALMIWLNKHCFNGLYRVNRKGLFNVPYNNRRGGKSIDEENARAVSEYLQKADVTITCLDFEKACEKVGAGDFVYFDSPYIPESPTASFTGYAKGGFSLADHERLAALFRRLDGIGAKVMLSNNDVPLVRSLYKGYRVRPLCVRRMINRDAKKRTGREVLITNY